MREGRLQDHVKVGPEPRSGRGRPRARGSRSPTPPRRGPSRGSAPRSGFALHIDARGENGDRGGQRLAPVLAFAPSGGSAGTVSPAWSSQDSPSLVLTQTCRRGGSLRTRPCSGGDLGPGLPRGIERGEGGSQRCCRRPRRSRAIRPRPAGAASRARDGCRRRPRRPDAPGSRRPSGQRMRAQVMGGHVAAMQAGDVDRSVGRCARRRPRCGNDPFSVGVETM